MAGGATANAAEIKVITSVGVKAILDDLAPQFERATEHKLKITFGTAVPLKRQIDAGETFDVVILTPAMLDDLAKNGKVAAGTSATSRSPASASPSGRRAQARHRHRRGGQEDAARTPRRSPIPRKARAAP